MHDGVDTPAFQLEMQDPSNVVPIKRDNVLEEAAARYWRASRIWRDHDETNWTVGDMIDECRELTFSRGNVAVLSHHLLQQVVTQNIGS